MLNDLDKQSLLVLYLADELSATDRAAMDAMLSADAGLASELREFDAAVQSFEQGMADLDAEPMGSDAVITRRVGQAMRQHMARKLATPAKPAAVAAEPRARYPWWAYPSVAAAVVLVAFANWWGHRPDPMLRTGPGNPVAIAPISPDEADRVAQDIEANFDDANPTQPGKAVAALDDAEAQVTELARSQTEFRYDANE